MDKDAIHQAKRYMSLCAHALEKAAIGCLRTFGSPSTAYTVMQPGKVNTPKQKNVADSAANR